MLTYLVWRKPEIFDEENKNSYSHNATTQRKLVTLWCLSSLVFSLFYNMRPLSLQLWNHPCLT